MDGMNSNAGVMEGVDVEGLAWLMKGGLENLNIIVTDIRRTMGDFHPEQCLEMEGNGDPERDIAETGIWRATGDLVSDITSP